MRWTENWLNVWAQSTVFRWLKVADQWPVYIQELRAKPVLFTPSLMTKVIRKSIYTKFDDDTGGSCAAVHKDLDRLKTNGMMET